jgi:hypothetical protein
MFGGWPWELEDVPISVLRDLENFFWATNEAHTETEPSLREQAAAMRDDEIENG